MSLVRSIESRIRRIEGFSVRVLDGRSEPVHGATRLSNLRESYDH